MLLCLYFWSNYDLEPVLDYAGRNKRLQLDMGKHGDRAILGTLVEDWFLAEDIESLVRLAYSTPEWWTRSKQIAYGFYLGWKVDCWVWGINRDRGTAPSSAHVGETWDATLAESLGLGVVSSVPRADMGLVSNRSWLFRWRFRHMEEFGSIRPVEDVSLEEKRLKVSFIWGCSAQRRRQSLLHAFGFVGRRLFLHRQCSAEGRNVRGEAGLSGPDLLGERAWGRCMGKVFREGARRTKGGRGTVLVSNPSTEGGVCLAAQ
jgi:hypothetical protein